MPRTTTETQEYAADLLARSVGVKFENQCLYLNGWGKVDKHAFIKPNHCLVLEVEDRQKHPCTNVLKLWPYLEEEPEQSIVLAHAFFQGGKPLVSSRGRLGAFVGNKMAHALEGRFQYCQITIDRDDNRIVEGLDELKKLVRLWKS